MDEGDDVGILDWEKSEGESERVVVVERVDWAGAVGERVVSEVERSSSAESST